MPSDDPSSDRVEAGAARSSSPADGEALRELIHRVKGGMNNAAISLQLLESNLAKESASGKDSTWVLTMALRGLTQAMRTLRLVAARTGVDVQPVDDSIAPSIDDIVAMLSPVSRRHQVHFESELDGNKGTFPLDASHVSEMLTVGVEAILQAGRSARVHLRYSDKPRPHYTLEVLPRTGTPASIDFFIGRRARNRVPR